MPTLSRVVKIVIVVLITFSCGRKEENREIFVFNRGWKFILGDSAYYKDPAVNDTSWRLLDLPHDWSIEGEFDASHPAGTGGGYLPGGVGWYRKQFYLDEDDVHRNVFIQFDGVYKDSEVWINGKCLGKRPNGYISFEYNLTPYLIFGGTNSLAVKVDNSQQPNSRWYSGSGIYRDVRLVKTSKVYVTYNGTYITTPDITVEKATIQIETDIHNSFGEPKKVQLRTLVEDASGATITEVLSDTLVSSDSGTSFHQSLIVNQPKHWSVETPYLYKARTEVIVDGEVVDSYETSFGIRSFSFDREKGFFLNNRFVKIKGVCLHHDLGSLGAAFNRRAAERQLEIMRGMGVNAIRTSHNPPAPQLLDLCDSMGFIVMDEMFDVWKKGKTEFDYSKDWDQWHEQDLRDFIKRDRNHSSVIVWSVGNEIVEQWDSTGADITRDLVGIVKSLDTTRPVTTGNNEISANNSLINSGALDLIGYNYKHAAFETFLQDYPGEKFIATETTSALATRGHYDMPSDSIRRWPIAWDKLFVEGNHDNTVSAYDNVSTPWGSTHEETWKIVKRSTYLSGMFIWTGFDYIGEPTPYVWPSRSSYFGVVDLAGFPKDTYYMYQSEWTDQPVLHVFPHWNWKEGDVIDVWAYYNQADEVTLFLNGRSLGARRKKDEELHVMWRVPYEPGTLRAVSTKDGKEVLSKEVKTALRPSKIVLTADRDAIAASGTDLSFITVTVVDDAGTVVPYADHLINFDVEGNGVIAGVDNGDPTSQESFKANIRKVFNGRALVILQGNDREGTVVLTASAPGLTADSIQVLVR